MARSSPLLMVDIASSKFYSLSEKRLARVGEGEGDVPIKRFEDCEVVGSSQGWIALFYWENNENNELCLWNPVSRRLIHLPPIHDLLLTEDYMLMVKKLILSSSTPDDADCRAVILYGPLSRLAFCCPGQSGAAWIPIGGWWRRYDEFEIHGRCYKDLAYSTRQNRLFTITSSQSDETVELQRWDLEDPYAPRMDDLDEELDYDSDLEEFHSSYNYIVVAEGGDEDEVLVVVQNVWFYDEDEHDDVGDIKMKTVGFNIYKVVEGDGGEMTLTPRVVGSLNGLALFVGINQSMALSAAEFPELRPDSVYFTDSSYPDKFTWHSSIYGHDLSHHDIGIFNNQNRNFYPLYSPFEGDNEKEYHDEEDELYQYLRQLFREAEEEDELYQYLRLLFWEEEEEKLYENLRHLFWEEDEDEYIYTPQLFWFTPTSVAD